MLIIPINHQMQCCLYFTLQANTTMTTSIVFYFFRIVFVNAPLQAMMELLSCTVGLVLFSYFSECDPLSHPDPQRRISSPNQVQSFIC